MSFVLRKAAVTPFTDSFSQRWAGLVQRAKRTKLFRKRSDHVELVAEFEALIADRKANDDLPYAALVAMSLGRYLETCAEHNAPQTAAFLEASECFWEAAHQDHEHGCTDPPEVLRLQAREAQIKALAWADKFVQSDIYLRASQHLCQLEEYDEAAFLAERSAELEASSLKNAFDAYLAFAQSTKCYALTKNFLKAEKVLHLAKQTAEKALDEDGAWSGFVKGTRTEGWQTTWTEDAIFHAAVSQLFICIAMGRNQQMDTWLEVAREQLELRNGEAGQEWAVLKAMVSGKRSESESTLERNASRAVLSLVLHEAYALVLLEAALDSVLLKPNWEFAK